ncbi:cAMP-regulated D2 protein-like [Amphiura filiformis]|uniref:cAMP-regulated D2 protein-like n=1 Tax=Amphiura filiformis TaxID=82378 RepID=UPI003B21EDE5
MRSMVKIELGSKIWLCLALVSLVQYNSADETTAEGDPLLVQTEYGLLRGVHIDEGKEVRAFLGIPYAAPPIGKFRWQSPQKQKSWDGVYMANEQPVGCPQKCGHIEPEYACPSRNSESCLYLDVYTPRYANSKSNLPVMVWLHGGNFQSGGAGVILYDARYIANISQVVVVSINYRLGALGFMVTSDGDDRLTGNYGFLDQQAALRFVRDNIANFGGNPNSVTLFGQSAGAQSIAVHLISEESKSLFNQAILMSDPFTIPYQSPSRAAKLGDRVAELLGCLPADVKCLRAKPADEVLKQSKEAAADMIYPEVPLQKFELWNPNIDSTIVPGDPLTAFQTGNFWRKPMIVGTISEECVIYIYKLWDTSPTLTEVSTFLFVVFQDWEVVHRVLETYVIDSKVDLRDPISVGCTDYIFGCSSRNVSRAAHYAGALVYHYIFDHAFSFHEGWGPHLTTCYGRVCHGGDLPFTFHSAPLGGFDYTSSELRLTNSILSYFGNFAYTGNPNNNMWSNNTIDTYGHWPEYLQANDWPSMVLRTPENQVQHRYREDMCNMWDEIGYNKEHNSLEAIFKIFKQLFKL